jgi:TonB family protein
MRVQTMVLPVVLLFFVALTQSENALSGDISPAESARLRAHQCVHAYPSAMLSAKHEGEVRLAFTISSEGRVEDVRVAQSSGYADFDNAAVGCAGSWKYMPTQREGQFVATPWTAKVLFHLTPHPAKEPGKLVETVVVSPG